MAAAIASDRQIVTAETAADNNGDHGGDFRNVQGGSAAVQKGLRLGSKGLSEIQDRLRDMTSSTMRGGCRLVEAAWTRIHIT